MRRIRLKPLRKEADQRELFQCDDGERPEVLLEEGGSTVIYWPQFLAADVPWITRLDQEIPWQQHTVKLFGRAVAAPRLSSWHGDLGAHYRYSGVLYEPRAWTPTLSLLRRRLEDELGIPFNAVLANRYRDGQDAMGWHSDDEVELGPEPDIASISLGATRDFQLKRKRGARHLINIPLSDRSLLLMRGYCQRDWLHGLPRRKNCDQLRINLTFRMIRAVALPMSTRDWHVES